MSKKSILNSIAILTKDLKKKSEVYPHIIIGVEADEQGRPAVIFSSNANEGGFIGLGMIKSLKSIINKIENSMEKEFQKMVKESGSPEHLTSIIDKINKINPEVGKILEKYKKGIMESLGKGDLEYASKLKEDLINDMLKKGISLDYLSELLKNTADKDKNSDNNSSSNFDINDISNYL